MSRYAILSDIHGNLEALQVVLADLPTRNVEAIWFLGDLVSYGPDPGECIRTLLGQQDEQQSDVVMCRIQDTDDGDVLLPVRGVRGNNDDAILRDGAVDPEHLVSDLRDRHRVVVDAQRQARIEATGQSHRWTLEKLTPEERHLLAKLALDETTPLPVASAALMHASPCDPTGREGNYLRTEADAEEAFVCDEKFGVGFFGHTHHAGVFRQFTTARMYDNVEHIAFSHFAGDVQEFFLDGKRVLINPGSVGQPRDGDHRAAYAVYDTGGKVEFYRIEYPRDKTISKLEALRGKSTEQDSMVDVLVERLREAG